MPKRQEVLILLEDTVDSSAASCALLLVGSVFTIAAAGEFPLSAGSALILIAGVVLVGSSAFSTGSAFIFIGTSGFVSSLMDATGSSDFTRFLRPFSAPKFALQLCVISSEDFRLAPLSAVDASVALILSKLS